MFGMWPPGQRDPLIHPTPPAQSVFSLLCWRLIHRLTWLNYGWNTTPRARESVFRLLQANMYVFLRLEINAWLECG